MNYSRVIGTMGVFGMFISVAHQYLFDPDFLSKRDFFLAIVSIFMVVLSIATRLEVFKK